MLHQKHSPALCSEESNGIRPICWFLDSLGRNSEKEKEGGVGICPHCGKSCKTHGILHYHKFIAHSTGSFPCDICGKIYTNVVKLKEHLKKTCKAQMIPCSICGAMLKGQRGVKGHMRSVHMDDKDKRYQCDICGKGFFSQDKLKCHEMSMHIKSRPHRCRYGCDIGYNDISNRNAHEKKTHGERYDLFIKNSKWLKDLIRWWISSLNLFTCNKST